MIDMDMIAKYQGLLSLPINIPRTITTQCSILGMHTCTNACTFFLVQVRFSTLHALVHISFQALASQY